VEIVARNSSDVPTLSAPADDRRFVEVVGERIALLGLESGVFECWMWPLEVCHDFHWTLHRPGGAGPLARDELERRVEVTPGGLAFEERAEGIALRTELFASRERRAIVLTFLLRAEESLGLEISFSGDFRPMWPAGLGGQIGARDPETGAFLLTEELGRFATLIGGPTARLAAGGGDHALPTDPIHQWMPLDPSGEPAVFVIAGAELDPGPLSPEARLGLAQSATGFARAEKVVGAARELWRELSRDHEKERAGVEAHWNRHLARTASFSCSDPTHDDAFLWSKIAIERAWVSVDGIGRGLVAGLAPSGGSTRPGYAWFFDGDAMIAARAMSLYGDFEGVREILRFAASHQREDGKLMHELTLSANLCSWLEDYPYAYYKGINAADFVISVERNVRASGDLELARDLWDTIAGAVRWCEGCTDETGCMTIRKAGIAAVEAGPLSDRLEDEVFLQGAWMGALRGAAWIAEKLDLPEHAAHARDLLARAERVFEGFWSPTRGGYGFAHLEGGVLFDDGNAYLGFPLSLGFGEPERAFASAILLNDPVLTTDWGTRMFAEDSETYDPEHYNTGAVFPFLTGYVATALFRHALAPAAHQVLGSQVSLFGFGGLGFVEEHLVGDRAEIPARGVPHQIFSSYVIPEVTMLGVLGLELDATVPRLDLRPSLPPHWDRAALEGIVVGKTALDLHLRRDHGSGGSSWRVEVERISGPAIRVGIAPLLPPLSRVRSASLSGEPVRVTRTVLPSGMVEVRLEDRELTEGMALALEVVEGPDIALPATLPPCGEPGREPRLVEIAATDDEVLWRIAGRQGTTRSIPFHHDEEVEVSGAEVDELGNLNVTFPPSESDAFTLTEIRVRAQKAVPPPD